MYAKYQTDALVLGSVPHGEADKRVTLYTREFGLVRARASAVRRESSRMRYALQSFSHVRVSLIRGETGWRVAGAMSLDSFEATPASMSSFARVAQLCARLAGGEEKNESLFSLLVHARSTLRDAEQGREPTIELLCVAHMLSVLGYLSREALGVAYATDTLFGSEIVEAASKDRDTLLESVNRALSETQL